MTCSDYNRNIQIFQIFCFISCKKHQSILSLNDEHELKNDIFLNLLLQSFNDFILLDNSIQQIINSSLLCCNKFAYLFITYSDITHILFHVINVIFIDLNIKT
jgi:hypothetical protein